MGEYVVHNVKLYDFKPQAIHCLSFDETQSKLAVSRADNSIEIWDLQRSIYQEKFIPGNSTRSIESLKWVSKRLFSTGLQGDLTEYDLLRLCPKKSIYATPSACWCMDVNSVHTLLAIGTEEGYICLFDVDNKEAEYERALDKQEGRILCLAWHYSGEFIVSGSVDVLRIWSEENVVCASGVDSTIISFQPVFKRGESERANWVKSGIRSAHTHDIRALTFANYFLVSGGVDSYLNVIRYPEESRFFYSPLPQCPTVQVAKKTNIMLFRYPRHLELWKLGQADEQSHDGTDGTQCKLVELKAKENETIVCCDLSDDSQWLAYSTTTQLRLFQVVMETLDHNTQISLLRVRYIPPGCFPCHRMLFTPDSSKLVVVSDKAIIHVLSVDNIQPCLLHTLAPPTDIFKRIDSIHLLAVSSDCNYAATGDHLSNVFVYDLKKGKFHCALPKNAFQPTAMAFNPKTNDLVVTYCDKKV
uniref:Uncharacterized protein n=1 Tax=Strigamia maritima TaxID=126957 RepID=T1J505_STRMM